MLKKNSKGGKAESSLGILKELLNSLKPSRMGLGRIRSINSKDSHSALSEKFAPFYDHFEIADSSSHFNHHITSPSTSMDIDSSSESLPFVEDSLPTNSSFDNANTLSDYVNCIFIILNINDIM